MRVLSIYMKTAIMYNNRQIKLMFVNDLHKNRRMVFDNLIDSQPKYPEKREFRVVYCAVLHILEVKMERRRTFGEYRAIDLTIFAVMTCVFEYVVTAAARSWFPGELYTVSVSAIITSIVYMRWGAWGAVNCVLSGLVYCLFSDAAGEQYVIYCAGNLFSLLSLPVLFKVGKERVRTGQFLGLLFPLLVQLLMHGGRALVALLFGETPATVAGFFLEDSLSYLFTLVIAWIVRRLDGVYEDQKHYLLRLQAKEEKKGG